MINFDELEETSEDIARQKGHVIHDLNFKLKMIELIKPSLIGSGGIFFLSLIQKPEAQNELKQLFRLTSRVQKLNLSDFPYQLLQSLHQNIDKVLCLFSSQLDLYYERNINVDHNKRHSLVTEIPRLGADNNIRSLKQTFYPTVFKNDKNGEGHSVFISHVANLNRSLRDILLQKVFDLVDAPYFSKEINALKKSFFDFEEGVKAKRTEFESSFNQDKNKLIKGLEEAVENAKSAALQAGVANHYAVFQKEATSHQRKSLLWLACLIIMVITTVVSVIKLGDIINSTYTFPIKVPETLVPETIRFHTIQYILNKIVILSALFYFLSVCSKNYKAHRHNYVLNKHRQNALATFQAFTSATDDEQIKNAVLLEATRTIFSNQHTGYMNVDADSDSPNKIIEIIKSTGLSKSA